MTQYLDENGLKALWAKVKSLQTQVDLMKSYQPTLIEIAVPETPWYNAPLGKKWEIDFTAPTVTTSSGQTTVKYSTDTSKAHFIGAWSNTLSSYDSLDWNVDFWSVSNGKRINYDMNSNPANVIECLFASQPWLADNGFEPGWPNFNTQIGLWFESYRDEMTYDSTIKSPLATPDAVLSDCMSFWAGYGGGDHIVQWMVPCCYGKWGGTIDNAASVQDVSTDYDGRFNTIYAPTPRGDGYGNSADPYINSSTQAKSNNSIIKRAPDPKVYTHSYYPPSDTADEVHLFFLGVRFIATNNGKSLVGQVGTWDERDLAFKSQDS